MPGTETPFPDERPNFLNPRGRGPEVFYDLHAPGSDAEVKRDLDFYNPRFVEIQRMLDKNIWHAELENFNRNLKSEAMEDGISTALKAACLREFNQEDFDAAVDVTGGAWQEMVSDLKSMDEQSDLANFLYPAVDLRAIDIARYKRDVAPIVQHRLPEIMEALKELFCVAHKRAAMERAL
jgi:hypothetical protein